MHRTKPTADGDSRLSMPSANGGPGMRRTKSVGSVSGAKWYVRNLNEERAVMLQRMIAVIGPPAAGKTSLTIQLAQAPGCQIFRLREHMPDAILAATATSADRLGWIDDLTVARALRAYIEKTVFDDSAHTVLLDNFPGSAIQVRLLLGILRRIAPACAVHAVDLIADAAVLDRRVRARRVCHQCERDPIHDP